MKKLYKGNTYFLFFLLSSSCVLLLYIFFSYNSLSLHVQEILAPLWNREFGLLESAQHIMLLSISVGIFSLTVDELHPYKKITLTITSMFFMWLFLEETDYLLHYYDFILYGKVSYQTFPLGFRNIHNEGDLITLLRKIFKTILVLSTLLYALYYSVLNFKKFNFIFLSNLLIVLVITLYIVSLKLMPDSGDGRQIASESRELGIYITCGIIVFSHLINKWIFK